MKSTQSMDGLEQNNKLTREQKIGVTMLFIFALLTAGLAFLQIRNNLVQPFVLRTAQEKQDQSLKDFQVELQNIDTDQDGLNDYEEFNFYTTSPYLPDTDSDGKTDKQEIDAGTDPLCAQGKQCAAAENIPRANTSTLPLSSVPVGEATDALPILSDSNADGSQLDVQELINNPQKIRQLLSQTGQISQDQLDKLDDATLIRMLQETLKTNDTAGPPSDESSSEAPPTSAKNASSTPSEQQDEL